jgi:hypothetical protein
MDLDMVIDDPKAFTKSFTLHMQKTLSPDTEILEDVCENERDRGHLESGVKLSPAVLASYAGVYEFAPGRQAEVTVSDGLLYVQEGSAAKVLYVPRSETKFLASVVNDDAIEFVKDAQGAVTGLVKHAGGAERKATRRADR